MASANSRFKVMSLTERAAERVKEIMANAERPAAGLRVGVKNGGCAGMSYVMEWAEAVAPHDEIIEDKGVKILIDPK
ncbi:MAG TPA: iron-sulfur cluster assembly accessory protein, partial [Beijerinckiaceae bacterium]|nr:iron-sulfur cluster assembly accessory protein [Beijerinckiaceae bacterium]